MCLCFDTQWCNVSFLKKKIKQEMVSFSVRSCVVCGEASLDSFLGGFFFGGGGVRDHELPPPRSESFKT